MMHARKMHENAHYPHDVIFFSFWLVNGVKIIRAEVLKTLGLEKKLEKGGGDPRFL